MKEHVYFVYMLASRRNGTLYTGVTNDVLRRTWQHKNNVREAIAREKQINRWNRARKIRLIEKHNSGWNDLYERLLGNIGLPESPGSPSLASR